MWPSDRPRVRERSGQGGFEGVGGLSVSAFEQVSVDVVGGADRGVPETLGMCAEARDKCVVVSDLERPLPGMHARLYADWHAEYERSN